jgi:hypothetical protein
MPLMVAQAPVLLTDRDYVAIDGYAFQRWGQRSGSPYRDIRPLAEGAARRVWERAMRINGDEPDDALPRDAFPLQAGLDLRGGGAEWDEQTVRAWLLDRHAGRGDRVLVCYGPQWAVEVNWGVFCDHWLVFLWVTPCCVRPASEEWFLRFSDETFVFGRSGPEFPTRG